MIGGRKPKFIPWSEEEFSSDECVRAMNPIPRWMYRTLLQSAFFCSCRPYLPDDDNVLWILAGCGDREQWEAHKAQVLSSFDRLEIDGKKLLGQKRLIADWERLQLIREAASMAGKLSGEARRRTVNDRSTNAEQEKLR